MTLPQLLQERDNLTAQLAEVQKPVKKLLENINTQIDAAVQTPLQAKRKTEGKDTGTVTLLMDGIEVKQVITKSVKWDQTKLDAIATRIQTENGDPSKYISRKVTLTVAEKEYAAWEPNIQAIFNEARTVKPGSPKITFAPAKEG